MELGAALNQGPQELGYPPTLNQEIARLQEKLYSNLRKSITSIQAVYVPADDLTDPAVVAIFAHLDTFLVLSREVAENGIYPAVDVLRSRSLSLDEEIVGTRHYQIAQRVRRTFQRYQELAHIIAILGVDELSREDQITAQRAQKLQKFLTQPFFTAESFSARRGIYVTRAETLEGCEKILNGQLDNVEADQLYMQGALPN